MKIGKDTSIIEKNQNNKIPKDGKLKKQSENMSGDIFHFTIFFLISLTTIQSLIMIFTKVVENPKMD